ncbi:hypothetical protein, conserved [Entamoeba dispar SAW760]|uniref:Calcineurin-like phosphoesterase domain-containing protein n=1 Tax=Entamoeba dispar (strain ATCC PRA-260 / SAW760) TaxID=370354 RepID=B0EEI1_ENTDS|nr:uncharacterized protein EDI_135490 [Entamoeba dispar SAW760]EDR27095.1 hypothetical protein, conserved [Entamoeba dispar SAW760]|eukprot:EDR27095.1 hypothetical protein, conserved [Entamoeba dispar SAW760]
MPESKVSPTFFVIALIMCFFMTFLFSITVSRLVLLIPFVSYDNDLTNVGRDFAITLIISLVIPHLFVFSTFIIFGCDFIFTSKWFRVINLYSSTIDLCIFNLIPFSLIYDVINIVLISTKLFGSSLFRNDLYHRGKFMSFVTGNYMPNNYRIVIFCLIILCSILFDIYSLWQGHRFPFKHITLTSPKVSKEVQFVHISDVHIGSRFLSHSQRIVKKILPIHPDFVVITGDLTDSPNVQTEELMPFKALTNECPVYMSTGNHDYMTGIEHLSFMLNACGITLLQNRMSREEKYNCAIIGTDDSNTEEEFVEEMNMVSQLPSSETYNIILQHRPFGYKQTCEKGIFDLMLCGHTHVGQFAPFSVFVYLFFKKAYGLYTIKSNKNRMYLYTHPGTGAWSAHMRSAGTNDITIFHIKPLEN